MMTEKKRSFEKGQSSIIFALLIPLFVIGAIFATDFGQFLVLQNQAQIFADGAAIAAASALDVSVFTESKDVEINKAWANARAKQVLVDGIALDPGLADMSFSLSNIQISGNEVVVEVVGSCATMWSKPFGIPGYTTVAVSSARAATGITQEIK